MVEPMFVFDFKNPVEVDSLVSVSGAEAKHAISVRRMRVGEAIQLTDAKGLRVRGTVDSISGNSLTVRVAKIETEPEPKLKITIVQALAKGDRDELAVQAATELGATQVIPWESERSISKWIGLKESKGVERWQTIATEAAKQSLRAIHPVVSHPLKSVELAKSFADFHLAIILDPTAATGLGQVAIPVAGRVALVVGPEGGISESELSTFEQAGAIRVNLGESILRTSTAGMAAIAAILALTGRWGSK